jgi:hypothetical protein
MHQQETVLGVWETKLINNKKIKQWQIFQII